MLGASVYGTYQLGCVISTGSIATEQVCELLSNLRVAHRKPINVMLDNARYRRNKTAMNLAETLGIESLFLTAYSPNLNLIKRMWKFVKAEPLPARVLPDFVSFRSSIESTLSELTTTHGDHMKTLITRNFQLFDDAPALA